MFLDDALHNRETQTGSLPEIFRCEKGVENPRADLFRHPMAVIGYAQAYMTVLSIEAQPEPPPSGMAWRLFTTRLISTWISWSRSAWTTGMFPWITFSTVIRL